MNTILQYVLCRFLSFYLAINPQIVMIYQFFSHRCNFPQTNHCPFLCVLHYFPDLPVKRGLDLIGKSYTAGGLFESGAMETLKKLHLPWNLGKRYNVIKGKENSYYNTPNPKIDDTIDDCVQEDIPPRRLRRNTSLTRSVRDVVGTLRQVCHDKCLRTLLNIFP